VRKRAPQAPFCSPRTMLPLQPLLPPPWHAQTLRRPAVPPVLFLNSRAAQLPSHSALLPPPAPPQPLLLLPPPPLLRPRCRPLLPLYLVVLATRDNAAAHAGEMKPLWPERLMYLSQSSANAGPLPTVVTCSRTFEHASATTTCTGTFSSAQPATLTLPAPAHLTLSLFVGATRHARLDLPPVGPTSAQC